MRMIDIDSICRISLLGKANRLIHLDILCDDTAMYGLWHMFKDSNKIKEYIKLHTDEAYKNAVHKAKGLEFENVIVVNVNDGVYPYFFNRNSKYRIKEDARKLYVAISRAKEKLVISYASRRRGLSWRGTPYDMEIYRSPFLSSIEVFFETEPLY